ncbi:MAG: quinohemoprotein amine dehydrogenase subunit alpha [Gemmatimonadetes bacterium]|nr:quinohemoprotein amine dehydrogenase subunit alpha [Gemmatimonadota bacterium]
MKTRAPLIAWPIAGLLFASSLAAQADTTAGYPIRDATVIAQCASCHAQDSTGRMSRISYMRKAPEGWETSIRRMATLNGAQLDPDAARTVLRYLSNEQGLAPEEAAPGRFEAERRMIDHKYEADEKTFNTCKQCHSLGRVILQRRTKEEWGLLVAMHRGFYPIVDFQGFRSGGPPPPGQPDEGHPMSHAINHLATAFPLTTPEWTAWRATMRPPVLAGEWLLSGTESGRGAFYGRMTIARIDGSPDEFTTRATYVYAKSGQRVTREGRAVVYTGFQWRGRSNETGTADQPWREVVTLEPGWRGASGRWYRGDYDEFGMDVTLSRLGADPVIAGAHPRGLQKAAAAQQIAIHGANLPAGIALEAIDFGPGVRVERVASATPGLVTVLVSADSSARVGVRDLYAAGTSLRGALAVYDSVSRIRVAPIAGMARVGGENFPKQFQQFDAIAYNDGPDGKPDTEDDIEIGPVDATWSLEEYKVTFDDDDLAFVGQLDARGLFTPEADGPNPKRSGQRNNVGDVWVVASWTPPGPNARPLRARGHLLVTVPLYMRWIPWRFEW